MQAMGQSTGEQATEPSRQMQLRHGSSRDGKVWLLWKILPV